MQGSLWRQRVGATEARQLTDGPGYDYQPDWSPDGRRIVYASYRDDAIELRLLDLATRRARRRCSPTARCNLEPRWSPDGRRLAFTSTRTRAAGTSSPPTSRRTAGSNGSSGITRGSRERPARATTTTRWTSALSPTWSPDGRELIVVSNRGHVWGSGGFWRDGGAPGRRALREIRDEETTWKARPDWSRDGRRVVYSSYLGGQWNQLWLMTAGRRRTRSSSPTATFDATAPRWSPDGRHDRLRLERGRQHVALGRSTCRAASGRDSRRAAATIARRWDGSGSG